MKHPPKLEDLNRFCAPSDPVLSPDGQRAVYTVRTVNEVLDLHEHRLWILDVATGLSSVVTKGTTDVSPRWSPDGLTVAFLRDIGGFPQLHLLKPDSAQDPVVATHLPLGAGAPVWSPDGTGIAFSAMVDAQDRETETAKDTALRRAKAPIVIRELAYKADGSGQPSGARSQLHVLATASLRSRALTNVAWNIGAVAWHPDGRSLLAVGAGEPDADRRATSSIYRVAVDADQADPPELFALAEGQSIAARWSKSGDSVLVVGRERVSPGHLQLLELDGTGRVRTDLAASLDRNLVLGSPGYPGAMPQQGSGEKVLFCARHEGSSQLFSVTLGDPQSVRHLRGSRDEVVAGMSVSGDRVAIVTVTPASSGHVSIVQLSTGVVLAESREPDALVELNFVEPVARDFIMSDGAVVHGWVLRHPATQGATPLLLDIHGGPHNAWTGVVDGTHLYHQVLAAQGWTVLTVNPPSSDGYGEKFFMANVGSWGHGDQNSFLESVDSLIEDGLVDPNRLAVAGYSYGGYSVCWLTSHTDRFAAAIAGGLICDTTGLVTSDEGYPELCRELNATPWEDADALLAQSPYASVSAVHTPTLILHGLADHRCPVNQAEQWFVALRARCVPTELVLYPGESHLFIILGRPSHRVDYAKRLVDWLHRFISSDSVNC